MTPEGTPIERKRASKAKPSEQHGEQTGEQGEQPGEQQSEQKPQVPTAQQVAGEQQSAAKPAAPETTELIDGPRFRGPSVQLTPEGYVPCDMSKVANAIVTALLLMVSAMFAAAGHNTSCHCLQDATCGSELPTSTPGVGQAVPDASSPKHCLVDRGDGWLGMQRAGGPSSSGTGVLGPCAEGETFGRRGAAVGRPPHNSRPRLQ